MMRRRGFRNGRHAFTLVELLVVVAIIALLISILLPTLGRVQEKTRQVVCMNNLGIIAKAWGMYKGSNRGAPPILPDHNNSVHLYFSDPLEMGDECTHASLGQGAQQNLCLLIEAECLSSWEVFLCPSTETSLAADRDDVGRKYGLGETDNIYCDYGIQVPYVYSSNKCPLTKHMNGEIAIMADRPPWIDPRYPQCRDEWSLNHPNDGENVMFVAGNVSFCKSTKTVGGDTSKNTCGWGGNNIYTRDEWNTSDPNNPVLTGYFDTDSAYPASTKDTVIWSWTP